MSINNKARAFIFDFDGTIANTEPFGKVFIEKISKRWKFKNPTEFDIKKIKELSPRQGMIYLGIAAWKVPFILWDLRRKISEIMHQVGPAHPEVSDILRELKNNNEIFLGIVSSNSKKNILRYLKARDLDLFHHVSQGSFFGKHKEVKRVLSKHGLDLENTYYVGDENRDVDCAKNSGLKIISVTWGHSTREALEKAGPDYIIEHPSELLRFI